MSQIDRREGIEGRAWISGSCQIRARTLKVFGVCEMWGLMVEW